MKEIKNMKYASSILSTGSIIVTLVSIILSTPLLDTQIQIIESKLLDMRLQLKILLLLLIELALGYGFGYLFSVISHLKTKRAINGRYAANLLNPVVFILNSFLAFISAWVTFFNIDLLVAQSKIGEYSRIELLAFFGIFICTIETIILFTHIRYCYEAGYSFEQDDRLKLLLKQVVFFVFIFFVFSMQSMEIR